MAVRNHAPTVAIGDMNRRKDAANQQGAKRLLTFTTRLADLCPVAKLVFAGRTHTWIVVPLGSKHPYVLIRDE